MPSLPPLNNDTSLSPFSATQKNPSVFFGDPKKSWRVSQAKKNHSDPPVIKICECGPWANKPNVVLQTEKYLHCLSLLTKTWPIIFSSLKKKFNWQLLNSTLWWWLPLRLLKRQSIPTTVLLRTTLQTRTITKTTTLNSIQRIDHIEQLFMHQCIWHMCSWLTTVFSPSRTCTQVSYFWSKQLSHVTFNSQAPLFFTRLVLKKTVFSVLGSKLNMGLINKGWYGTFFTCWV